MSIYSGNPTPTSIEGGNNGPTEVNGPGANLNNSNPPPLPARPNRKPNNINNNPNTNITSVSSSPSPHNAFSLTSLVNSSNNFLADSTEASMSSSGFSQNPNNPNNPNTRSRNNSHESGLEDFNFFQASGRDRSKADSPQHTSPVSSNKSLPNNNNNNNTSGTGTGTSPPPPSYKSLTHIIDIIGDQTDSSIQSAERMGKVIKKLVALEEQYAKDMKKIVEHEFEKIAKEKTQASLSGSKLNESNHSTDTMLRVQNGWNNFLSLTASNAQIHASHASRVMLDTVVPLMEFSTEAAQKRKQLISEEKRCVTEMAHFHAAVNKELAVCERLLYQAQKEQAKITGNKAPPPPEKNKSESVFSLLSSKVQQLASKDQPADHLYSNIKKYSQTVEEANRRQLIYYGYDLPNLLEEMERLEATRLDITQQAFQSYGESFLACVPSFNKVSTGLGNLHKMMNSTLDRHDRIISLIHQHGETPQQLPYEYGLPCSPEDAKAGRYQGNPTSIFRSTLSHCMKLQQGKFWSSEAEDVPHVLNVLVDAIRRMGGITQEGIFRISPSKSELNLLHQQLDESNYNLSSGDVNAYASMLKEWLRLLAEPVIPRSLYMKALNIAQTISDVKAAQAPINSLFESMDPLNQRVLKVLIQLVQEISDNSAINKMSLENLAVCFAPCLLRPDESSLSQIDPATIMARSKAEPKFVAFLFQVVKTNYQKKPAIVNNNNKQTENVEPSSQADAGTALPTTTPIPASASTSAPVSTATISSSGQVSGQILELDLLSDSNLKEDKNTSALLFDQALPLGTDDAIPKEGNSNQVVNIGEE